MISHEAEMAPILNSSSIRGADWLNFRVLSECGEGREQRWRRWVLLTVADPEATAPQPGENAHVSEDSGLEIEMTHNYRCSCKWSEVGSYYRLFMPEVIVKRDQPRELTEVLLTLTFLLVAWSAELSSLTCLWLCVQCVCACESERGGKRDSETESM